MMTERLQRITEVPKLPPRRREGHKGDYGRVVIVGGSPGMIGATALAANAAFRGGAGLVTFAAPRTIQQGVAVLCPCATSIPLECDEQGAVTPAGLRQVMTAARQCDVLAVGPGMGVGAPQQEIVAAALEQDRPVVLDADGLNNLARIEDWPARRRCPLVLTPHPGEFSRLTAQTITHVQGNRAQVAVDALRKWTDGATEEDPALVVVLKGAGTVVTNGRRFYVNDTGNPGMACGGSGDILTGLVAAMIGQSFELFDAACLAVRVHGHAGDLAAAELGEVSLMASDLLDYLPQATKDAVG